MARVKKAKPEKKIDGKYRNLAQKFKARVNKYAPKPKRPANGYTLFLKEFAEKKFKVKKNFITTASTAWRKLSNKAKEAYKKRAASGKEIIKYKADMTCWKQEKQFLKAPPNSYALFVHHFWRSADKSTLNFGEISKRCSQAWHALHQSEKSRYAENAKELTKNFQDNLTALKNGTQLSTLIGTRIPETSVAAYLDTSESDSETESSDDEYNSTEEEDEEDYYSSSEDDSEYAARKGPILYFTSSEHQN